jgi:hypothetical protein
MPCNRATHKRLLSILAGYFTGKDLNEPHWEFWLTVTLSAVLTFMVVGVFHFHR